MSTASCWTCPAPDSAERQAGIVPAMQLAQGLLGLWQNLLRRAGRRRQPGMNKMTAPSALPLDDLPVLQPGPGFDLLAGVRVPDLTGSIAGPYATMLLGDFGADVLKV